MEVSSMDQSIETAPLNLVRQVFSGTRNRRQNIYRRRKKKRTLAWEEETDLHQVNRAKEEGHVDLLC